MSTHSIYKLMAWLEILADCSNINSDITLKCFKHFRLQVSFSALVLNYFVLLLTQPNICLLVWYVTSHCCLKKSKAGNKLLLSASALISSELDLYIRNHFSFERSWTLQKHVYTLTKPTYHTCLIMMHSMIHRMTMRYDVSQVYSLETSSIL